MKKCKNCFKKFQPKYNNQQNCSLQCSKQWKLQTWKKYYKKFKNKLNIRKQNWIKENKSYLKKYNVKHYQENLEKNREKGRKYYKQNREIILKKKKANRNKLKIYKRKYDLLHRKEQQEYRKNRKSKRNKVLRIYMQKPINRILRNLRIRLCDLLNGRNKSITTLQILGCSLSDFKKHLEKQFKPGMTWNNYGRKGWHIDHIQTCASFDLNKDEEQRKCFHYSNLRPLWATENLRRPKK